MCFGSTQSSVPDNPAPYALNQSQAAVTQTTSTTPLNAQAAAADAQDKPTAPVTGATVSSGPATAGLQTATL